MLRAVFLFAGLLIATGCAGEPAASTAARPETALTPYVTDDGHLVYRDSGTNVVEVCGLVPARRVGELLGRSGVSARENGRPSDGNHVGTCEYTAADVTLSLSVHAADPTMSAEEFVKGVTEGKGQPIQGLGDAAALVTYDDGYARLAAVQKELLLLLTGTGEHADDFPKIAEEALSGLPFLP